MGKNKLKVNEFMGGTISRAAVTPDVAVKESGNLYDYINSVVGKTSSKFARDIFENVEYTTHAEKKLCKKYYRENSLIYSSLKTKRDLLLGDCRKFETGNPVLKKFMEDSFLDKSGWIHAEEVAIEEALATGDGYIERLRGEKTIRYVPIYNSEDMYVDYDFEHNHIRRYILRVEITDGVVFGRKIESFDITTPRGRETINGIDLGKDDIIHYRHGSDVYGVYGRSDVASCLADLRILEVIERSVAVISKYKAIPKYIIHGMDNETPLEEPERNVVAKTLKDATDYETPILSKPVGKTELSYGGKEINMQPYIDYLKRKITISMAPEFLIHGEEVNRATSREQKQTYYLRIASERVPLEAVAWKELNYAVNFLSKYLNLGQILTFDYKYGDFDIELPLERDERIRADFIAGLITLKEAREEKGLRELQGIDLFKWEIEPEQPEMVPPMPNDE